MITLAWDIGRVLIIAIPVLLSLLPMLAHSQQVDTLLLRTPTLNYNTYNTIVNTVVPVNNFISVTGTSQVMDTGKVYSAAGTSMQTFTLPPYNPVTGASTITITGTGSCLYQIVPNSGQTQKIVGVNGIAATGGVAVATSPYCTTVLRYNGGGQWKVTLSTGSFTYNTYKSINAVGSTFVYPVLNTVNNTTETEIFRDTIYGNTFPLGQDYSVEGHLALTTPLVSVGTVTLKFYYGASSVSFVSGGGLTVGSLAGAPIVFYLDLTPKASGGQVFCANIQQPFPVLNLTSSNSNMRQSFSEDATTDKVIRITVTQAGINTGTSVSTDFIKRNIF